MGKFDVAIMYSGGLDSFIGYRTALSLNVKPVNIWVNLGQDYNWKERRSIQRLTIPITNIEMPGLIPAISYRMKDQIIPSRNLLFAVIGSMFAPTVWIMALHGEQTAKSNDKSKKFFENSSQLLSYTNEHFQPQTRVYTPFSISKRGVIHTALKKKLATKEEMFLTSSCYHPVEDKCGTCLTCYKRYAAFLLNDIEEPGYSANPLESDYAKEMDIEIPKAHKNDDYSKFNRKRMKEYFLLQELLKK